MNNIEHKKVIIWDYVKCTQFNKEMRIMVGLWLWAVFFKTLTDYVCLSVWPRISPTWDGKYQNDPLE